jgi:hypothetical protein
MSKGVRPLWTLLAVTGETARTWAAVAGAMATSAAVLLALYRETFREWRLRPKLALAFAGPPFDAITVSIPYAPHPGRHVPTHWLRLEVSNAKGRRSARDVQVLLTAVHRIEDLEKRWHPLDTVALIWSNQDQPRATIDFPPATSRRIDVASLEWPAGRLQMPEEGGGGCWAKLQVIPTPSSDRDHLDPGLYQLELALTAWDVDAVRYTVNLNFDGTWMSGSSVWSHFRLENLKRLG